MESLRPLGLLLKHVLPDLQDLEEPSAPGRDRKKAVHGALGIAPKHFVPRLYAPRCG